jgi:hypothetical protein
MAALPAVYQFPSFMETVGLVKNEAHQCIWYLPSKKRRCLVSIPAEDERNAVQLASRIWGSGPTVASAFVILAEIAEVTCYVRHHCNKYTPVVWHRSWLTDGSTRRIRIQASRPNVIRSLEALRDSEHGGKLSTIVGRWKSSCGLNQPQHTSSNAIGGPLVALTLIDRKWLILLRRKSTSGQSTGSLLGCPLGGVHLPRAPPAPSLPSLCGAMGEAAS